MGISTGISLTPLPRIPDSLQSSDPVLFDYLNQNRLVLQQILQGYFTSVNGLTTAVNKGTSGSFTITTAGHIVVTSGIITAVTMT